RDQRRLPLFGAQQPEPRRAGDADVPEREPSGLHLRAGREQRRAGDVDPAILHGEVRAAVAARVAAKPLTSHRRARARRWAPSLPRAGEKKARAAALAARGKRGYGARREASPRRYYSAAIRSVPPSAPEDLISAICLSLKRSTSRRISSVCSPKSGERFT